MERLETISKNSSYTHDALFHKGILYNWHRNFNVSHLCNEDDEEAMIYYNTAVQKAEKYLVTIAKNFTG